MKAIDLDWKCTAHTGKRQRDMRKGMSLAYAYFFRWSRFCIEEVYQRPNAQGDAMPTLFVLRDAHRVTDAQVRAGETSPIIARSYSAQRLVDHALAVERDDAQRNAA